MNAPYGFSPGGGMPPGGGQPPGYNPYAAPQAGAGFRPGTPAGIQYRAHGGGLKWAYLGCLLGGLVVAGIGGAVGDDVGAVLAVIGVLTAFFGRLVVALIWIYGAWAAIPADYRVTSTGKRVSPGEAIGFLFIPFYNLYWMFVASGGLCDALDYLLRSSGSQRTAPKGLAMGAAICQFIPYVNLLIAPFLWFFYMLGVDSAAQELQNTTSMNGGAGAAGAAPQGFGAPAGYGAPPAGGYGGPPGGGYGAPPGGGYGGPPGGGYGGPPGGGYGGPPGY